MAKKFKVLLLFISLSLSLCLMSNTYSRYVADATGNLEVLFAKWQILVNTNDITQNTSSSITLVPVIDENEYVEANKIAPASKGHFDIAIDPSNADVSFNYNISLSLENTEMPDLMITKYAILDNTYLEGDTIDFVTLSDNVISGSQNFDNTIENFAFEPFTIRVYFEWYEGTDELMSDTEDTVVGTKAATEETTFKINTNIEFEQKLGE